MTMTMIWIPLQGSLLYNNICILYIIKQTLYMFIHKIFLYLITQNIEHNCCVATDFKQKWIAIFKAPIYI